MNNTIEFVVKMRNMMSGELSRLSTTAQSSFTRMSQHANGMTTRNQILGMSFNELQRKIQQVEGTIRSSTIPSQIAEARRELSALQRQSVRHSGNIGGSTSVPGKGLGIGGVAIGSMLGGFAMQAGTAMVSAVGSGVSAMISKSMEKEQAITGLTTFLGKEGATEAYKNIRKDANATPFDTASLLEVNRSLISAGLGAKEARKDTLNLANAVSAVGGGNDILSRMAANMQQIKTVGKATAMDIRQFGIAGINIYEMLARSTGKNIEQVKEMDVSYQDLAKSLEMANAKGGIYEGAMLAQSQTMTGKWNTFKDNLMTAASDIWDAFNPLINEGLDLAVKFAESIAPALEKAKPYITEMSDGVSKMVSWVMQLVNGTSEWSPWVERIKTFFSEVWKYASMIAIKLWNLVSSIIEFIKKSAIIQDIFMIVGDIFLGVMNLVNELMNSLKWLWDNIIEPVIGAIDTAYRWIGGGAKEVKIKYSKDMTGVYKPGFDPKNPQSVLDQTTRQTTANTSASTAVGDTISGGGTKTININVGKFFDTIQFTTMNGKESAQELENIVMETLSRVLYNGAKMI